MPEPRRRTGRSGPPDLKAAVKEALGELIEEERDKRDPRRRQDRTFARLDAFLDGMEDAARREGPPRGRGQRDEGEDDDEDEEGEPSIFETLFGGGGRR